MGWNEKRELSKLEMYTFLRKEESYLRSLKIRKTKLTKNKDKILSTIRSELSDLIQVSNLSEYEKNRIAQFKETEPFQLEEGFVLRKDFTHANKISIISNEFGLSNLENLKINSFHFLQRMIDENN